MVCSLVCKCVSGLHKRSANIWSCDWAPEAVTLYTLVFDLFANTELVFFFTWSLPEVTMTVSKSLNPHPDTKLTLYLFIHGC